MQTIRQRALELLSPARDADTAIEAIRHGADAIYIGGPAHGARAAAANSVADIARTVEYAHQFDARVYVTLNTLLRDDELRDVERTVGELYRAGVDALIVQDMAMLRLDIPPIALHASTQCDIRTPERARFLEAAGMSQIVIARELTLDETARICSAVSVPVEAFVHGALCVSYSGACYASYACGGRSANRGECAQICRLPYTLRDSSGHTLLKGHLLSLRDLNRINALPELAAAGVSSFKIEGRLKDTAYVKNVTSAYRQALDRLIDSHPDMYRRASSGKVTHTFTPALDKSFNRGFTSYFTTSRRPATSMASFRSPKWLGEEIGTVTGRRGTAYTVRIRQGIKLSNGDGAGFFDTRTGGFTGFRINSTEGNLIRPASRIEIPIGTTLLRNRDTARDAIMASTTATRTIDAQIIMRRAPSGIALEITDASGRASATFTQLSTDEARTPQEENHRQILAKTGDTVFRVTETYDHAGTAFIPASTLTAMRRTLLEALESTHRATYRYGYRRAEAENARDLFDGYTANVTNSLARGFYTDMGATDIGKSIEQSRTVAPGTTVMTTRYCLRREAGRCLRTPQGKLWKEPLTLCSGSIRFPLCFDCRLCGMHLLAPEKQ